MTHQLQAEIVRLLRAALPGLLVTPTTQIIQGAPTASPRPLIAVYGGECRLDEQAGDFSAGLPRPMELREEFAVLAGTPKGPYPLAKTPLQGSALGHLVFDKGGLDERRRLITETNGFSIDYANARLLLLSDVDGASHIQLTYSFAGVFFLQDFRQEFFIEVLAADGAAAERLASLAATVVFTRHDELKEAYNRTGRTTYSAAQYLSEHWIGRISWIDSRLEYTANSATFKMRFSVDGQIKHVRSDVGGFGIIESIRSPGAAGGNGVDIEPELG